MNWLFVNGFMLAVGILVELPKYSPDVFSPKYQLTFCPPASTVMLDGFSPEHIGVFPLTMMVGLAAFLMLYAAVSGQL